MFRLAVLACIIGMTALPVLAAPPVTLELLDGGTRQGELTSITDEAIQLQSAEGPVEVARENVMLLQTDATTTSPDASLTGVGLADGTHLSVESIESNGTDVTLKTPTDKTFQLSVRQVAHVRFAEIEPVIAQAWSDLLKRDARDDLLVIRKGEVLDYVAGSVGRIASDAVVILVGDQELSAPRERLFGIIFANRAAAPAQAGVGVTSLSGDRYQAQSLSVTNETLSLKTASLGSLQIPLSDLKSIDFGGGRLKNLASLPFDDSGSVSPNPDSSPVWFVSLNAPAGAGGKSPLQIGKQEYQRGLWLHSGARLRYRLNREYTQLRAVAGFELTHVTQMPRFEPRVELVISGDGRELFRREFAWNDAPQDLDVNLTDVRELVVEVRSLGGHQGVLEHFALGNAQLIQ